MKHSARLRLAACGVLLAAPLALTACGSSDDDKGGNQTSAPAAGSSSAPQGVASGEPTPGVSTETGGGDSAGKPSKAEVSAGLKSFYDKQGGQYTNALDTQKFADCMAGKSYDTMSAKSLNAMKDGKPEDMDKADASKLGQYGAACAPSSAKMPVG